jgi:outer membrane immunogenic protein
MELRCGAEIDMRPPRLRIDQGTMPGTDPGGRIMKWLRLVVVGLTFGVGALPVVAADVKTPQQVPQAEPGPSVNWNGPQAGLSNGLSIGANNFVERGAYICGALEPFGGNCIETPTTFGAHQMSYTAGPFLGWRWQSERYVSGIEADWSWKRAGASSAFSVPSECYAGPGAFCRSDAKSGSVTQNWDSSFRARYGFLVTPSWLLYATGGLALGEISGAFSFNSTVASGASAGGTAISNASWVDRRAGGTIGAGIETALWSGWKARIEYRYTDFGTYTKTFPVSTLCGSCASPSRLVNIDLRESFHAVRIGLGFDF